MRKHEEHMFRDAFPVIQGSSTYEYRPMVKVICSRKESLCICLMTFKENIPKSDKGTSIIRHHGGLHLANAT